MTYEEILKAVNDLSEDDKKKLHQSLKDRIDESVADQERESGTENSQTAKDRVDESLGEEEYEEERREEENDDSDDEGRADEAEKAEDEAEETEEELEEHEEADKDMKSEIYKRLDSLETTVAKLAKMLSGTDEEAEKAAKEIYGLGNGTFAPEGGSGSGEKKVDVRKTLRNLGL